MRELSFTNVNMIRVVQQVREKAGIWIQVGLPPEYMFFLNYCHVFLLIPLYWDFLTISTSAWFLWMTPRPSLQSCTSWSKFSKAEGRKRAFSDGEMPPRVEVGLWPVFSDGQHFLAWNQKDSWLTSSLQGSQATLLLVQLHCYYSVMRNKFDNN